MAHPIIKPTLKEKTQTIQRALNDYPFFINEVFALSFPRFKRGAFIDNLADWMSLYKWTMRISARDHFKSTSLYADIMLDLLRSFGVNREHHYFSYQESMAGYHIEKIKGFVRANPYYESCVDLKPTAESVIKYSWDINMADEEPHFLTVEPHGMLGFKRGIHCDNVYIDDPFQDPDNKMLLTKIYKINDIMKNQILDMPREACRIVGTPQTNDDFFFDSNLRRKFALLIQPAEVNTEKQQALWPEHMDWEELQERKRIRGAKVYNQEYLCTPVYSEESYFTQEELQAVVNTDLPNRPLNDIIKSPERIDRVAGWDLGKKRHPAHFTVFEIRNVNGQMKAIQIHDKWFDGVDYTGKNDEEYDPDNPTQFSYVRQAIRNFKINSVRVDNTRGELTTLEERGELPKEVILETMSASEKYAIATELNKAVSGAVIELLNEERSIRQMCAVTNDLQAVESPMGHGDSFWSNAMALKDVTLIQDHLDDFVDEDNEDMQGQIYEKTF